LFSAGQSKNFSIYSAYDSYDKLQADFLDELQQRFETSNSIFYLWYNPPSNAFPAGEAKLIRSYEALGVSLWPLWGRVHPFMDEIIESGFSMLSGSRITPPKPEDEERDRAWRFRQPALRVSRLDAVLAVTDGRKAPQLQLLYKSLFESRLRRWDRFVFAPFADFFLLSLLNGRIGSSDAQWVELAEGKKIPMPPRKGGSPPSQLVEQLDNPPTPRHTITLTVRSTLPNVG